LSIIQRIYRKITREYYYRKYKNKSLYLSNYAKVAIGYNLNLDNPKTFNEKINWYKLNYFDEKMILVTDKVTVDEYVKSKNLDYILIKKLKIYDDINQIKYEDLPVKFVMKINSDSGGVWVCRNLTQKEFKKNIKKLRKKMNVDYSKYLCEWNYKDIQPKIIIEELIDTGNNNPPNDYKFFCFYGEPRFLFVASDRPSNTKFDFYDMDWNYLDVKNHYPNSSKPINRPDSLDEMIEICRILSSDFPHVRVDLYYENNKIYFGELTFFHFSGLEPFKPFYWDVKFGEYFDLSKIRK